MTEEEKPTACPFCAAPVVDEAFWFACEADLSGHHVFCLSCGAEGPRGDTLDLAIEAWNRRSMIEASPSGEGGEERRLAEALQKIVEDATDGEEFTTLSDDFIVRGIHIRRAREALSALPVVGGEGGSISSVAESGGTASPKSDGPRKSEGEVLYRRIECDCGVDCQDLGPGSGCRYLRPEFQPVGQFNGGAS